MKSVELIIPYTSPVSIATFIESEEWYVGTPGNSLATWDPYKFKPYYGGEIWIYCDYDIYVVFNLPKDVAFSDVQNILSTPADWTTEYQRILLPAGLNKLKVGGTQVFSFYAKRIDITTATTNNTKVILSFVGAGIIP